MSRLSKNDIEIRLLSGTSIEWREAGKAKQISLPLAVQRRLFSFLLKQEVRDPKNLPESLIQGLETALLGDNDPAIEFKNEINFDSTGIAWRLDSIETDGFGGLNAWGGPCFKFNLDGDSFLIDGPNGSGKSSLIGAILWGLTGERPRDQTDEQPHQLQPVYGADEKVIGKWPPIASYPSKVSELSQQPFVRVRLTFCDRNGNSCYIERTLKDGEMRYQGHEQFSVPPIFFETGMLMPTRLTTLRFDERKGRLSDAIQRLTGLDDLAALGGLVTGLCHGAREYLAPLKKEYETLEREFQHTLEEARQILETVSVIVPKFEVHETKTNDGPLGMLGKQVSDAATKLTSVISDDLSPGLDLKNLSVQASVISALSMARKDLSQGIEISPTWRLMRSISENVTDQEEVNALSVIKEACKRADEALILAKKTAIDSKFQLKATAAQWHYSHSSRLIEQCPLCEGDLLQKKDLVTELEALGHLGEAATKTFNDNLNSITELVDAEIPAFLRNPAVVEISNNPRVRVIEDLKNNFINKDIFSNILAKLAALIENGLEKCPLDIGNAHEILEFEAELKKVYEKINIIQCSLYLAKWYKQNAPIWQHWWEDLYPNKDIQDGDNSLGRNSPISQNLLRVSEALSNADPYRRATELMRRAWSKGLLASKVKGKLGVRETVVIHLEPLKALGALAESVASETINGLSERVEIMLKSTLLTDKLKFQRARMNRKDGLMVHGGISDAIHIDATLVANTAWLRAVLWAFIFALREEAVEQFGRDPMRLVVFDDPQLTFDGVHRHRWTQYVNSLQSREGADIQVLLVTHDEAFLELVKVSGLSGRDVMLLGASEQFGNVKIFEGAFLERKWKEVNEAPAPDWKGYIAKVREHLELLLRIMVRAEGLNVMSPLHGYVIGDSREKIDQLNKAGMAPWNRVEFKDLVNKLDKTKSAVKHLEMAHHTQPLGNAEAMDVEVYWRKKLNPSLLKAFKIHREHYHLHGRLNALHEPPTNLVLPDGYPAKVKSIPLILHGKAAALTNGRVADGCIAFEEFDGDDNRRVVLANHHIYRLTASTLEPVARVGDMVLVKVTSDPLPKALVVALCDNRMLARRYELADNHNDVAVLTAHSIHPHKILPQFVAHKATLKMSPIVGVIYDQGNSGANPDGDMEFCSCEGESSISNVLQGAIGLVQVSGHSAVPYALDGQFLIVGQSITDYSVIKRMVGCPIIAADDEDRRYFKRLQMPEGDHIVLESLDTGGDYAPILLSSPGQDGNSLARVWPVLGVLFEK